MAYVELRSHEIQEQVYHVLEGEGLMHIDGSRTSRASTTSSPCPQGVEHDIANTGLVDRLIAVTSPTVDTVEA